MFRCCLSSQSRKLSEISVQAEAEAENAQRAKAQAEAQLRSEREAAAAQEQAMRDLNRQVSLSDQKRIICVRNSLDSSRPPWS